MITVICGTNRNNSYTRVVCEHLQKMLKMKGIPCELVDVSELPMDFYVNNEVYGNPTPEFTALLDRSISSSDKFVFVTPEYNGSFPGITKTFIDSFLPARIRGKKAALVGVSSGRAGNLRGMDHLTGVLNYLNMIVLPFKPAIAHCNHLIDLDSRTIQDAKTQSLLDDFITQLEAL
ncbi:NAD(P)H-dependent oxidoreductase [bacterium SCSIO 12741]|nr:NAD(P)H-dependent oxidoreductase [bacterium SCSIO 12741]